MEYICKQRKDTGAVEFFNACVKSLKDNAPYRQIFITGFLERSVYYDSAKNMFYYASNLGGYRHDSIQSIRYLTEKEEEELYSDIQSGGIQVFYVPAAAYASAGFKQELIFTIKPFIPELNIT